jgi:hypothetical protein
MQKYQTPAELRAVTVPVIIPDVSEPLVDKRMSQQQARERSMPSAEFMLPSVSDSFVSRYRMLSML